MLGDLQLSIMEVVWDRGSATVAEVHEVLQRTRELAYTTVLSTLRGLERRRFLDHTVEGKAHRFRSRVTRDEYTQDRVRELVTRLFEGNPAALMNHLLGSERLEAADLSRIRALLEDDGRSDR